MATLFLVAWSIVAFAVGAWVGLKLPDVDQRTDLLLHRSIITHGPLVPLVLFLLLRNVQRTWVRMLPMSVCLGFVVHLAFDLFPWAWSGYALISMPVYGWLPGWAVHRVDLWKRACVCLLVSPVGPRNAGAIDVWSVGAAGIFIYAVRSESALFGPLVVAAAALLICGVVRLFRSEEQSLRD